jgi:hypothetical protein
MPLSVMSWRSAKDVADEARLRTTSFRVRTTGLAAGHADTLWVMVFNHPERCSHPPRPGVQCGIGDLEPFGGDPAIDSSVLYGAGHVIGATGRATFAGTLAVGDADGALFGNGLTNPAEGRFPGRRRRRGDPHHRPLDGRLR